jgi:deoxyribodipyrimidine photo-lyase
MPKKIVYWFRNDLRLHDNEGFCRALTEAETVWPVFVIDTDWFTKLTSIGFRKMGVFQANFLLESLADLRKSLRNRGSDLLIRVGSPASVLAQLAQEVDADAIYASKEVTQEETDLESDLSKRLKPLNIDLELIWQSTLYHVRDLPFAIARLPNVFTQFRKEVEKFASVRALVPVPESISPSTGQEAGPLPMLADLGYSKEETNRIEQPDARSVLPFHGGETVGFSRLEHYLWGSDQLKTYKDTRNGMLGEGYSSKFSAWLALGCLSPRFIYHEIKRYEAKRVENDSTYWLVFELIWRDFFRFVALRFGNRIFKISGIRNDITKRWRRDHDLFLRWAMGETGIPFIDANMRELNETGFMSNRGRQNVGSFLVKDLGIDWTWGAAYFESQLIDYDPCSNWGNWNYVAGVGNDPREDRYFNILSQATRYDEQGAYVKHWLPELADVPANRIHKLYELPNAELERYNVYPGDNYPLPIIRPERWTDAKFNR